MKVMKKTRPELSQRVIGILAMLLTSLAIVIPSLSNSASSQSRQIPNPFLPVAILRARQLKDAAQRAIAKLEAEIQKNRTVADRCRKLIEQAVQRNDDNARRAAEIAAQALKLAEKSLAYNEKTLAEWRARQTLAERSLSELMRMLKEGSASQSSIMGMISGNSGRAQIIKPDGSSLNLGGDSPAFLRPGDRIRTSEEQLEFMALDGRATTQLDKNSELAVIGNTDTEQYFGLVRGRLHGVVEKFDSFLGRLKQGFEDYKEDLRTIKDAFNDEDFYLYLPRRDLRFIYRRLYHGLTNKEIFDIDEYIERTGGLTTGGVRGTEFVMSWSDEAGGEVWVLDGEFELTFPGKEEPVLVKSGYKCTFSDSGVMELVPFEKIDRWWEK